MRRILPVVAVLATLASPSWACTKSEPASKSNGSHDAFAPRYTPARDASVQYPSGDADVKSSLALLSCSPDEVDEVMKDVVKTQAAVLAETDASVSCGWVAATVKTLKAWIAVPRSRPEDIPYGGPVSDVIAVSRARAETARKWAAIERTAETLEHSCDPAES